MTAQSHRPETAITRRAAFTLSLLASTAATARAVTRPAPGRKLTLVALFPSKGAESLVGDEAWRGAELAVAASNRHYVTPIDLVRVNATDPARFIAARAKSDPPTAFIGTASSTLSFAATAAAELANIPYVELDAPADGISTRGFKMLTRIGLTTSDLAVTTISAIIGQIAPVWHKPASALRIAILFDDGATNGSFAASFLALARQTKLPILMRLGYATDTTDLAREVARMQRAKIDLLIHAGRPEHVMLAYTAMATSTWRPRMVIGIGSGYALSAIGFVLGSAINNTMVVDAPLYDQSAPAHAISQAYQHRYAGKPRSSTSLTSYVGTSLVADCVRQDKPLTEALRQTRHPRGALANGWGTAFTADGQNSASFATLQQWRAGRLITIDPTMTDAHKPIVTL